MFPGNDIVSSLIAVQMGGTGGGVISLHDLFLQQETIVEVPLIGDYKQIFKWLPDYAGQTVNYQFSDYSNNTPEGHWFAVWEINHYKPYAVGMYRGDEYIGISMLYGMNISCPTIYSPNSDYTSTYLSEKNILKLLYDYSEPTAPSYSYNGMLINYMTFKADIERTTYTESGTMTKNDVTKTIYLPSFGAFQSMQYPYADSDRIAACIVEYARLCNAKYHELN